MQKLVEGIHQFQHDIFSSKQRLFEMLAEGQHPLALFITCSDSRIDPSLLTQTEPGELFILRNAGNIIPPYGTIHGGEAATIEFAVRALGVKDIVICGHSHCGAMKGLLDPKTLDDLPAVRSWLSHADATQRIMRENYEHISEVTARLTATVEEKVLVQLENLRTHPTVAAALGRKAVNLHGWVYKFETGQVFGYDAQVGQFVPIEGTSFTALLFTTCQNLKLDFLPVYGWVGLWSGMLLMVLAVTDASALMRYFTRFTDEIFAALIAVIFIVEAIKDVAKGFKGPDTPHDAALLGLFLPLVKLIPMSVLFGLFLFMGFATLAGNEFFTRFRMWAMDPRLYPTSHHFMGKVPNRVIHGFTAVQVVCLATLWIVKSSPLGLLFPVLIALLVPIRISLGRIFDPAHLQALDADAEAETIEETDGGRLGPQMSIS